MPPKTKKMSCNYGKKIRSSVKRTLRQSKRRVTSNYNKFMNLFKAS